MPPKGSKKAPPASSSDEDDYTTSKKASPVKKASPTKKGASPKKASPVKSGRVAKASPAKKTPPPSPKKASSPRKAAPASPKKAPSPRKTAPTSPKKASPKKASPKKIDAYRTPMTRHTLAASNEEDEIPAIDLVPGTKKPVFRKRGLLGTKDNDDDPTQPTDELIAAFDKRSLTKADKFMIENIERMEEEGDYSNIEPGEAIQAEERKCNDQGKPLNCHTKIYWRFHDLIGRSPESPSKSSRANSNASSAKGPGRPRSSRAASPAKKSPVGRAPIYYPPHSGRTRRASPPAMTRPMSRGPSRSPTRSASAAGPAASAAGITKARSMAQPATRTQTYTPQQQLSRVFQEHYRGNGAAANAFKRYEEACFKATLSGNSVPQPPAIKNIPYDVMLEAQMHGYDRAQSISEDVMIPADDEPDTADDNAQGFSPPNSFGTPRPAASSPRKGPRSPGKKSSISSPKKGPRSPGKQPASPVKTLAERFPGRGSVITFTNPEMIGGRANPFFEPMPAPEVWHRRMPPFFPFGETPYMQKVVSDQINADLSRNRNEHGEEIPPKSPGVIDRVASFVGSRLASIGSGTSKEEAEIAALRAASPWTLPKACPDRLAKIREMAKNFDPDSMTVRSPSRPSAGPTSSPRSPRKKARTGRA